MTTRNRAHDKAAAKSRRVALVLAATGILWAVAQFAGSKLGWSQSTRALFDLAAGAGFLWALVVIYQIWRARQGNE